MVVCLHEEHAVSIADGYSRVADEPMAVALHSNVGLMHATMTIFNAWCDRRPMLIIGATGPVDAHKRRPWIDWIHTSQDQASIIRPYIKWDDQPASAEAAVEAVLRADQIARTAPDGPGLRLPRCARCRKARSTARCHARRSTAIAPARRPKRRSRMSMQTRRRAARRRAVRCILVGRGSRGQAEWDARVALGRGARVRPC